MTLTRRRLLELAGLGALAGCTKDMLGPEAESPIDPEASAASFEVDSTSALLWAYSPTARVGTPVLEVESGRQIVADPFAIRDGVGHRLVAGLSPLTRYRWRLRFDNGTTTDWHRFRTAPGDDQAAPLHMLVAADLDLDPIYDSPILATMAATGADLFVSLGDWPYADNAPVALSVDEYRARHAVARNHPRVRPLLQAMSARAIYDDHEAYGDWSGTERASPVRLDAALGVWDEWFPLRDQTRRYRSWRWGGLAEMFLLDVRLYRSPNAVPDSANKTMLGAAQREWLIRGVRESRAAFKLVFTPVPLDFGNTGDDWTVFATERAMIFDALREIPGVVFMSADQHWFAAHHHTAGFTEWQVGPLARLPRTPSPTTKAGVVRQITGVYNYGEILIESPGRLTFRARDPNGAVLYSETLVG